MATRKTFGAFFLSRASSVIALLILISVNLSGQTSCVSAGSVPLIHAEGLAESVGAITLTCAGASAGTIVTTNLILTMSANITNRLDANGNPTNISVTVNTGVLPVSAGITPMLFGSNTLFLQGLQYTAPAGPTTISISGLFVAIGSLPPAGTYSAVTAQVTATGGTVVVSGGPTLVGQAGNSLLDSLNDNGIPCSGSPLPATPNFGFNDLIAANTSFSTIRVTEAIPAAFAPKAGSADTGVRILVNLSGYGSATQVFVPDAIVGSTGTVPTSAGDYLTATVSAGTYTPGQHQLLLIRVNSASASGAGGQLAMAVPAAAVTFSSVTALPLTNGSAYAVYEVVDANPNVKESAQIPVFVTAPGTVCPSTAAPSLSASLAPISTVALATQTDPIPRFIAFTPELDCTQIGDCSAPYFPVLVVYPTTVTLNGSSFGAVQKGSFGVGNGGGGLLQFTQSITYQSGSGWLSLILTAGRNGVSMNLTADPSQLAPGTYQATVAINAGLYGSQNVPVTFNVGPQGAKLAVSPAAITLSGSSYGAAQQASLAVSNAGTGQLSFNLVVVAQTGGNWLSATPLSGTNATTINVTLDPGGLLPGTYQGTITLNAGLAGTIAVPVIFNVGAQVSKLAVSPASVVLSGLSLGTAQQGSFAVNNAGAGQLAFTTSIAYQSGSNWLSANPTSGTNSATINLTAAPAVLTPGTYQATVTVNAGAAGSATVAVTFNVAPPGVTIQGIVNAANLQPGPITVGSFASIFGAGLAGNNVQVTFNTLAATVIYDGPTQINVLVPAGLGSATQASVIATIDGQVSNTFTVTLTQNAPAVFNPGILNQNNSVNLVTQPASPGNILQIFLTGLATPVMSPVTVTIGSLTGLVPVYAGVSSISGLEQVNVQIPSALTFTGNSAPLSICIAGSCSAPVTLYLN
jgi:uncharacterized protein (TIGR03437 family)